MKQIKAWVVLDSDGKKPLPFTFSYYGDTQLQVFLTKREASVWNGKHPFKLKIVSCTINY